MSKINIGFIGTGNMGFAIIKGIFNSSNPDIQIYAYDTDSEKLDKLKEFGVIPCLSENEVADKCKYVVLAVKPQVIDVVLNTISSSVNPNCIALNI